MGADRRELHEVTQPRLAGLFDESTLPLDELLVEVASTREMAEQVLPTGNRLDE